MPPFLLSVPVGSVNQTDEEADDAFINYIENAINTSEFKARIDI